MSAAPAELLLMLATPALLGGCVARLLGLRAREDALAFVAWSWLLGTLLVAVLLLVALASGAPLAALRWLPPSAAAVLLVCALGRTHRDVPARSTSRSRSLGRALLLAATAACLVVTADRILRADETIVSFGDEGFMWSLKAKAIWAGGGFTPEFGALVAAPDPLEARALSQHADYPLLNPLLQAWSFACAGGVTHVENRLVLQLFAPALILLVASAARRVASDGMAAAAVILVALSSNFRDACYHATADLLVACSLLASLDAWSRHVHTGERRFLGLFAALLAGLAWSKNEGTVLAAMVACACLATGRGPARRRLGQVAALLPAAVLVTAQWVFNATFDLNSDILAVTADGGFLARVASQAATHLPVIGRYALDLALVDARASNLVPALVVPALLLFPVRLTRRAPATTTVLLAAAAAFTLVYLGTPRLVDWHLKWSLPRILLQLAPLCAVWLCAAAAWLWRPSVEGGRLA